jgi:hypothetical protein
MIWLWLKFAMLVGSHHRNYVLRAAGPADLRMDVRVNKKIEEQH